MFASFQSAIKRYYFAVITLLVIYALAMNKEVGELCAGIAILLFGMLFLGDGFRAFSGGFLEKILAKSTKTSVKSVAFGTVATAVMQSSSLVSVLAISFVSASLIGLTQGIGVMFGANLGNSAGSWLIAGASSINISSLALPFIVGGLLCNFQSSKAYKGIGKILAGLGFFFLGVFYIKAGFESFQSVMDLSQYQFEGYKAVAVFLFLGALMTSIVQSSHATLAVIITAFLENQISYDAALAAVLGTSVGGVVTALVASLGANVEGRRLAIANCVFNFTTVFIVAVFFPYFKFINDFLSDLIMLDANSILRLAMFHTLFNIFGVVLLIGFIPTISTVLTKLLKSSSKTRSAPLFINDTLLSYPDTAIRALTNEVKHLYDNAFNIISHSIGFHRVDIRGYEKLEKALGKKAWLKQEVDVKGLYKDQIKSLFNAIVDFSTKLQSNCEETKQIKRIVGLQIASRKIAESTKNIGLLQNNIKKYALNDNTSLKKEYDNIRLELAELLRTIEQIKTAPKKRLKDIKGLIKKQRNAFKKGDRTAFVVVEDLIRQKAISADNGTSLLNDIHFANNVVQELVTAINHIYGLSKNDSIGELEVKQVKLMQKSNKKKG